MRLKRFALEPSPLWEWWHVWTQSAGLQLWDAIKRLPFVLELRTIAQLNAGFLLVAMLAFLLMTPLSCVECAIAAVRDP
jgi:hypothetical protein